MYETLSCGSVHYVRHGRHGKLNVKFIYYYYYYYHYYYHYYHYCYPANISYMLNKLVRDGAVINFERSVSFGQAYEKEAESYDSVQQPRNDFSFKRHGKYFVYDYENYDVFLPTSVIIINAYIGQTNLACSSKVTVYCNFRLY